MYCQFFFITWMFFGMDKPALTRLFSFHVCGAILNFTFLKASNVTFWLIKVTSLSIKWQHTSGGRGHNIGENCHSRLQFILYYEKKNCAMSLLVARQTDYFKKLES